MKNNLVKIILNKFFLKIKLITIICMGIGDWGLGIGDWGLGPQPHTPNPKPPAPNPKKKNGVKF